MPTERGTYRRVFDYWTDYLAKKGIPNTYWAELCCPGCGKVMLLGSNHTVNAEGVPAPSCVCPFPPCNFHEFITLADWAKPSTPRRAYDNPPT